MTRTPTTIDFWCGRLPHWEVEGGRYFITIHLAGAIPNQGKLRLQQLSQEVALIDDRKAPEWLQKQRMIFQEMERWLDRADYVTHLKQPQIAAMVCEAVEHRQQRREWQVFEFVVMPTHIHLFCETGDRGLYSTLKEFKRWTGHEAVKILGDGKQSRFWQREWFDHWSRSDEEDEKIIQYIRANPVKAGLVTRFEEWPYGSWNVAH
jgi:putative transposase